jgi:iron complex transport system permease protein
MDITDIYKKRYFRWSLILVGLIGMLLLTMVLSISLGAVSISGLTVAKILLSKIPVVGNVVDSNSRVFEDIIIEIRLPRVILASIVGASLSVAGCAMQSLFRNPMADPYIIGISSGAAFGVTIVIVLEIQWLALPFVAFLFACLTICIVYCIARVHNKLPTETLLLSGIAVGAFFAALVGFMIYIAGEKIHGIVFWLMGGLWNSTWNKVIIVLPLIVCGIFVIFLFGRKLNLLMLGEDHALSLGIDVELTKKIILICASLITACAVSVSGIIGFVGLIIPHCMRLIVGPDHRILIPTSCLVGAIFLIWTDTLARTIIQPTEIPVGIITALFGAPFFVYLLKRRKKVWN